MTLITKEFPCPTCKGTGELLPGRGCNDCRRKGKYEAQVDVPVWNGDPIPVVHQRFIPSEDQLADPLNRIRPLNIIQTLQLLWAFPGLLVAEQNPSRLDRDTKHKNGFYTLLAVHDGWLKYYSDRRSNGKHWRTGAHDMIKILAYNSKEATTYKIWRAEDIGGFD